MFAIIFAQFTSVFGDPTANFMASVDQVALYFLYLSLAACVAAFFQVGLKGLGALLTLPRAWSMLMLSLTLALPMALHLPRATSPPHPKPPT